MAPPDEPGRVAGAFERGRWRHEPGRPSTLACRLLPLYNETERRRHEVRPGLTGLAQGRGRNRLTWQQRFAHDIEYVDKWTLWLDSRILMDTVPAVLRGRETETEFGST